MYSILTFLNPKLLFFILFLIPTNFIVHPCQEIDIDTGSLNTKEQVSYPEIRISSAPNHLKFISNGLVLIEASNIVEVRIDCWAPFPITLEFHGHLSNRRPSVELLKRTSANLNEDPSSYCFFITTTISSYEEIIGNYSCVDVKNSSRRSSYYILHSYVRPTSLVHHGQAMTVSMSSTGEGRLIIPCPISIFNVTVHLYNQTTQAEVNFTKYDIEFDPKIGFKVPISFHEFLGYDFQCRTELSDDDKVDVHIVLEKKSTFSPSQSIILPREGELIKVSCESTEEIMIHLDYFDGVPDLHLIETAEDVNRADAVKKVKRHRYNITVVSSREGRVGDNGRISCRAKESPKLIHEWSFSVIQRKGESKNNLRSSFDSYSCQNSGKKSYIKLYECNNWLECTLRKCKNNDRTCESQECHNVNTFKCLPCGIIQCFNYMNESSQEIIYFTGLEEGNYYTNWELAPISDILKIQIFRYSAAPADDESGLVKMICEGSSFVFAVGFKWSIKFENGVESQIPEDQIKHTYRSIHQKYILKSTVVTFLSKNMTHVICRAPIWNSTEWIEDVKFIQGMAKEAKTSSSVSSNLNLFSHFSPKLVFFSLCTMFIT